MARYRTTGRLDDQVLQEGDRGFRGIDSYLEATSLEPGFVRTSENMRLIGDLAEVRKGIDFLAGAVTLSYMARMRWYFVLRFTQTRQQEMNMW